MFRPTALAALVLAFAAPAPADDKKDEKKSDKPALTGVWTREAGGIDLKFDFTPDKDKKAVLKITAGAGDNGVTVVCKYTVDKDGRVKATVTDVEEKGTFPQKPPKGLEFSFRWKVKADTATLDELTGEGFDEAKPVIEGEYEKKKDEKKGKD